MLSLCVKPLSKFKIFLLSLPSFLIYKGVFVSRMQKLLPGITFPWKHNENFIPRNFSRKVSGFQFLFLGFFSKKWTVTLIDLMPHHSKNGNCYVNLLQRGNTMVKCIYEFWLRTRALFSWEYNFPIPFSWE